MSIWDVERGPWATFGDQLVADDRERRADAMFAILRWPGASLSLLFDAHLELDKLHEEHEVWIRDMEARRAAFHQANPGSEWDRRAA